MAAGQFLSLTRSQRNPRSFPTNRPSSSHGSPSFPRGHADQGGRPWAGSAAALPRCVSPPLGERDGGSRGGTGLSILASSRPGVTGGGAPGGGADGSLLGCRVCSRSFRGVEAFRLHTQTCRPAPAAAAAEPPALLLQQEKENRPSMTWTRLREPAARVPTVLEVARLMFPSVPDELLGMAVFAKFMGADEPAVYRARQWYACDTCGERFDSGQRLGGHVTRRHRNNVGIGSSLPAPAANVNSFKRPAIEAAPRNGKRRCIRLFGVDIVVEAPEE